MCLLQRLVLADLHIQFSSQHSQVYLILLGQFPHPFDLQILHLPQLVDLLDLVQELLLLVSGLGSCLLEIRSELQVLLGFDGELVLELLLDDSQIHQLLEFKLILLSLIHQLVLNLSEPVLQGLGGVVTLATLDLCNEVIPL